jgi:hypothetical protein
MPSLPLAGSKSAIFHRERGKIYCHVIIAGISFVYNFFLPEIICILLKHIINGLGAEDQLPPIEFSKLKNP